MIVATPQAQAYMDQGAACYQAADLANAKQAFESALEIQPNLTSALFNLAIISRDLEENEQAESLFRRVVESGEIVADAKNNLGIISVRMEKFEDAETWFREAIETNNQHALAHFNLSSLLLRQNRWEEGWRESQWRWQTPGFTPLPCPQPQWQGQQLDGTLLLHTEQGIGDTIQFCRFIPLIRSRCRRLILVRPNHLECLLPIPHWADEATGPGTIDLSRFDAYLPLMSAPHVLGTAATDLPFAENYLTPQERTVTLPCEENRIKIGLLWSGSPTYSNDRFRSMPASYFESLFDNQKIDFCGLQIGDAAVDFRNMAKRHENVYDLSELQSDLADLAAIVQQLDLVITVDTFLIHLCGAMSIPTWGLLSRRSDWRWLSNDRTDSPWYPTVRLFRQSQLNDWAGLMEQVNVAIKQLFG